MIENIPTFIKTLYSTFEENGFLIYLVGGCVRNLLLDTPVKDWDLTTNATPEQMLQLFPDGFYDNAFGTVGIPLVVHDEKVVVEVTTFRTEGNYTNRRHPGDVSWGKTIEEDLERRDFTMNAIALQFTKEQTELVLIDPYQGKSDINQKLVRAVGYPHIRFQEDALRLLRAVRFATELSFTIDPATWAAIQQNHTLIKDISAERVRDELLRICGSEHAYDGIVLLKEAELLQHILPELMEGIGVSQVRPGRHHQSDVFTHNILSLKFCPSSDPVVKFAALLHDIGKPRVMGKDEDGYVVFYNHEVVGATIARDIAQRLRLSKKQRDKVVNLIRWHMFTVDEHITDAAIRRFIRRVGIENVKDMMDLRIGDRLGGGTQTAESWRLKLFKDRVEKELQPAAFNVNDLAIDGNDIMQELNMKPSKKIGELLQKLFEDVDEDHARNTKEYLLQKLHELATTNSRVDGEQ